MSIVDDPQIVSKALSELGFGDNAGVIAALSAVARLIELPTGTVIFEEGELHDRLYFVCEGTVALEMSTTRSGKQRILTMAAGDVLAWSAMLGQGRMTSSATALEPVRMIEFAAEQLKSLCQSDHEVGFVIMSRLAKALSRRLLATRLQLLDLYHVEER